MDSDATKLRTLAEWFDLPAVQARNGFKEADDGVQQDLRRMADRLERIDTCDQS